MKKKGLSIMIVIIIMISIIPQNLMKKIGINTEINATEITKDAKSGSTVHVGDCVYLGKYPYNRVKDSELIANLEKLTRDSYGDVVYENNKYRKSLGNWYLFQPIKWTVLSITDGNAFLISTWDIEVHSYDKTWSTASWSTCECRSWLNSTFYEVAFSNKEKNSIYVSDLTNNRGQATSDRVFLLSRDELANPEYGLNNADNRKASISHYAYDLQNLDVYNNIELWLLRDSYVNGMGYTYGVSSINGDVSSLVMTDIKCSIRPCIRADVSNVSSSYEEYITHDTEEEDDGEEDDGHLVVVSLGDSFSSGEGIPPFYGQDEELT